MIDTKELRRLAQAASHPTTKGRWVRLFGERTVYDRMEDGCRGIPVVATDKHPPSKFESACLDFIAAANPAAITSLLDRLEEAESECLEQARLNGMGTERDAALMAKLEAAEKERDFAKVEIARLHDDIRELTDERVLDEEDRELWTTLKAKSAEKERDNANAAAVGIALQAEKLEAERDALRAKVAGLVPIGLLHVGAYYGEELQDWEFEADQQACDRLNEAHFQKEAALNLYALPGAQPAPSHALDDNATIAGLESAVTHLSVLLDSFRALLVEVNDVCGRDGHGGPLEEGESEIIDKVRAAISMTEAPPCAKGE